MDLKEIQRLLREGEYEVSFHAQQERLEEDLDLIQIEAAIINQGNFSKNIRTIREEKAVWYWVLLEVDRSMWFFGWARMKTESRRMIRLIAVYSPTMPKWTDPRTRGGRS